MLWNKFFSSSKFVNQKLNGSLHTRKVEKVCFSFGTEIFQLKDFVIWRLRGKLECGSAQLYLFALFLPHHKRLKLSTHFLRMKRKQILVREECECTNVLHAVVNVVATKLARCFLQFFTVDFEFFWYSNLHIWRENKLTIFLRYTPKPPWVKIM